MNNILIHISDDKLEARLSFKKADGRNPSKNELIRALNDQGVRYGIDEQLLETLAAGGKSPEHVLIAKGDRAERGQDAHLQWMIEVNSQKPTITESNRADFKRLKLIEPVAANQALVKKIPATKGKAGLNVFGETYFNPGQDLPFPEGDNTTISADGLNLLASTAGYALFENGRLNVKNIYKIQGDVNYATGNIKFDGPVVVEGDIRSGFRVEATGSIFVGGNVEAAIVYSQKGDVTIQYGILGKGRAKILAGGKLECGYIQDATVSVRGDVVVDHYIINSNISAGGIVSADKEEGLIRGGSIISEKGISAIEIGSAKNVFTELKIRNTTENEGQSRLWDISRKRTELNLRLSGLKKKQNFLELLITRVPDMSETKKQEKAFLADEISRLEQKFNELEKSEFSLQRESTKETMHKQIWIYGELHGNVSIDIGGIGFFNDRLLKNIKLYRLKQEVLIESLLDMDSPEYDLFVKQNQNMI